MPVMPGTGVGGQGLQSVITNHFLMTRCNKLVCTLYFCTDMILFNLFILTMIIMTCH